MFCTSLRQRPEWAPIIPELYTSTSFKFWETALRTHDLALPLPSTSKTGTSHLRVLLLSPSSVEESNRPETISRLERFSTLTGGDSIAIAFLLYLPQPLRSSSGMHAYMALQALLLSHSLPIPILPLPTPTSLLPTLTHYVSQFSLQPQLTIAPLTLLPHTTTTAPLRPLPEHTIHILSDLYHSLAEVATATGSEAGRRQLTEWVGEEVAVGMREFWADEWVCE
ncbi:hypothetical protein MMC08_005135 [Hypocenomyce scalaris]|nr:hypothetical protein [Hypocenomyce scalaris]